MGFDTGIQEMNGLDYAARLSEEAREKELLEEAQARREGEADRLEPAFPYTAIPFEPATFGAIPSEMRERE